MAMPFINDVLPLVFAGIDTGGAVLLTTDDTVPVSGTELLSALAGFPVPAGANAELWISVEAGMSAVPV